MCFVGVTESVCVCLPTELDFNSRAPHKTARLHNNNKKDGRDRTDREGQTSLELKFFLTQG